MESKQTTQMVAWLDEERRKDKALISKLEEKVSAQAALITDQTRRLQMLEGELSALRASIITASRFDDAVARIRTEINTTMEQIEERRQSGSQDLKKMRDIDRDAMQKALDELRTEILERIDREIQPRRAEEERLSRVAVELQNYASNLTKGFEEFERSLTFLEEQRRGDSRRMSEVNSELAEIAKRLEGQQAKFDLLEDLSRRNERRVEEVDKTLADQKQQRQAWMEQEALAAQERERAMGDMVKRLEAFAREMEGYARQVENWAETHRTMRKYVEDFDRVADRVDRRLNEVAEIQRISEERFRHEWEDFMQDDQKRWRQFTLNNEEAWRGNEKLVAEIQTILAETGTKNDRMARTLTVLTGSQQDFFRSMANHLQTMREQLDEELKK